MHSPRATPLKPRTTGFLFAAAVAPVQHGLGTNGIVGPPDRWMADIEMSTSGHGARTSETHR